MQAMWTRPLGRRVLLSAAGLASLFVLLTTTSAQDPRLVLNIDGPNSRVRGLAFSTDSHRLYCGGFSKVVNVWDIGWNLPPGAEGELLATPVGTLRWEIARALRGHINALDLAPIGSRLAIGGTGARDPSGTIVVFDTDRNEVEAALPPTFDRNQPSGHVTSVIGLDFSPSGNLLVSVSLDGEIWLWTAPDDRQADWAGKRIRPAGGVRFDRQPVLFLSEQRFVAAERVHPADDTRWRLALYSIDGERLRGLPQVFEHRLNALAINSTRTSLVATDSDGRSVLISTDRFETTRVLSEAGELEPSAVDFGPEGLVAVTRNERPKGAALLELWDAATGEKLDSIPLSRTENSYSCVFSPDGRLLAAGDDESLEVHVFQLRSANGQLRERPLNDQSPTRLRGRGQIVRSVHFERSPDPDQSLRIGMALGADERINTFFTPQESRLERVGAEDVAFDAVGPDTFAGGWKVGRSWQDFLRTQQVELISPTGRSSAITLDITEQGAYQGVHCFIPNAEGLPRAVAIGTDTQAGIFVYRLSDQGGNLRLVRYYRDHTGDITSISVTPDGRYLLSAAKDQTVKVWSLAGLEGSPQFARSCLWGAEFALRGGELTVENVLPAGIAYRRNLRNGDQIESLWVSSAHGPRQVVDANEMLAALESHAAVSSVFIQAVREEQPLPPRVVVPGWEPLLTIFIDDRDEWATFTPEGYYDASVAEGQRLFGWQVNRGSSETPRFDPGGNLQKEFERPDVIRDALRLGSVAAALSRLKAPMARDVGQTLARVPIVKIVAPLQSEQFEAGGEIRLVARVDFPDAEAVPRFNVTAFHAGRALGPPQSVEQDGLQRTYEWRTTCDELLNELTVTARESGLAVRKALHQGDAVHVRGRRPDQLPAARVHILAIGLEDYNSGTGLPALQFAIDDVEDVVPRFSGRRYQEKQLFLPSRQVTLLTDHEVTLPAIEQAVGGIERELAESSHARRDLVICYMCGHGSELDGEFYLHPTSLRSTKPDVIRQESIPWTQICQRLNALPCHVVWMIDACHSGAAVDAAKAIVREANLPNRFVLAASTTNQVSYEDSTYKVDESDVGHGAFTMAVLRGLDGLADGAGNGDEIISTAELAEFVRREVRSSTVRRQTPCYVPTSRPPLLAPGGAIPLLRASE